MENTFMGAMSFADDILLTTTSEKASQYLCG